MRIACTKCSSSLLGLPPLPTPVKRCPQTPVASTLGNLQPSCLLHTSLERHLRAMASQTRTSRSAYLPQRWPASLQYLDSLSYHGSVPEALRSLINPSFRNNGSKASGNTSRPSVAIRPIVESSHPAFGQYGLFATKKIPPHTHILDYLGEVHCDDRPDSDYDLSLFRSQDGISVGVDASRMGNEARFINDFRGVKPKPNIVFQEQKNDAGDLCMGVWSSSETIKKGEELLVSYGQLLSIHVRWRFGTHSSHLGKSFWKARASHS